MVLNPRCNMLQNITDAQGKLQTEEIQVTERGKQYFDELLEEEEAVERDKDAEENPPHEQVKEGSNEITREELEKAIQKIKITKQINKQLKQMM